MPPKPSRRRRAATRRRRSASRRGQSATRRGQSATRRGRTARRRGRSASARHRGGGLLSFAGGDAARLRTMAACAAQDPGELHKAMDAMLEYRVRERHRAWPDAKVKAWVRLARRVCVAKAAGTLRSVLDVEDTFGADVAAGNWTADNVRLMLEQC